MSLLSDDIIKSAIEMQAELGSKQGLSIDANKGQETDLDEPDGNDDDDADKNKGSGKDEKNSNSKDTPLSQLALIRSSSTSLE